LNRETESLPARDLSDTAVARGLAGVGRTMPQATKVEFPDGF
jgi:hypothetical protein